MKLPIESVWTVPDTLSLPEAAYVLGIFPNQLHSYFDDTDVNSRLDHGEVPGMRGRRIFVNDKWRELVQKKGKGDTWRDFNKNNRKIKESNATPKSKKTG